MITQIENYNVRIINKEKEPVIEFYDSKYTESELGLFLSSYYISTILEGNINKDMTLEGKWKLSPKGYEQAKAFINKVCN